MNVRAIGAGDVALWGRFAFRLMLPFGAQSLWQVLTLVATHQS